MKTLADELKELAGIKAEELRKQYELDALNKEKAEQERIDLVLQKAYDYFQNNWLEVAKKETLYGRTHFNISLQDQGRWEQDEDYDNTSDCYLVTGAYIDELYDIIMKKGISYFDTLCKQIKEQGFTNVKITCKSWDWTTFSCESITSYSIYLSGDFK